MKLEYKFFCLQRKRNSLDSFWPFVEFQALNTTAAHNLTPKAIKTNDAQCLKFNSPETLFVKTKLHSRKKNSSFKLTLTTLLNTIFLTIFLFHLVHLVLQGINIYFDANLKIILGNFPVICSQHSAPNANCQNHINYKYSNSNLF